MDQEVSGRMSATLDGTIDGTSVLGFGWALVESPNQQKHRPMWPTDAEVVPRAGGASVARRRVGTRRGVVDEKRAGARRVIGCQRSAGARRCIGRGRRVGTRRGISGRWAGDGKRHRGQISMVCQQKLRGNKEWKENRKSKRRGPKTGGQIVGELGQAPRQCPGNAPAVAQGGKRSGLGMPNSNSYGRR